MGEYRNVDQPGVGQEDRGRGWTLPAAAAMAAIEATALIAVVLFRGQPSAPYVTVLLATKYPFCWLLLRRRHSAYFAVLGWEVAGLGLALLTPNVAWPLRLAEATMAGLVLGLLMAAAHLFPPADLSDM